MSIRHLVRKFDPDAIARVKAGIRYKPEPVTRSEPPRKAETYRGARRNAVLRADVPGVWRGAKPDGAIYRPPVRANRSTKWAPFKGHLYALHAR